MNVDKGPLAKCSEDYFSTVTGLRHPCVSTSTVENSNMLLNVCQASQFQSLHVQPPFSSIQTMVFVCERMNTPPKLNSSPLKNDGKWRRSLTTWDGTFSASLCQTSRVCFDCYGNDYVQNIIYCLAAEKPIRCALQGHLQQYHTFAVFGNETSHVTFDSLKMWFKSWPLNLVSQRNVHHLEWNLEICWPRFAGKNYVFLQTCLK